MVSNRCKMAVKEALRKLGLHFILVDLGEVEIMEELSFEGRQELKLALQESGLELMDDKRAVLIEKNQECHHRNGTSYARTTTYIDIPIFIAVKPVSFITLVAGPQFSYLIKKRDQFESSLISTDIEQEFKNENVRKNTFCFALGVDININHLVFSARAAWDILHNNGDGTTTTPRYKNVWFQGTIGLRL